MNYNSAADDCALIYYSYMIIVGSLGLIVVILSSYYNHYQRPYQDLAFYGFLSESFTDCPRLDIGLILGPG